MTGWLEPPAGRLLEGDAPGCRSGWPVGRRRWGCAAARLSALSRPPRRWCRGNRFGRQHRGQDGFRRGRPATCPVWDGAVPGRRVCRRRLRRLAPGAGAGHLPAGAPAGVRRHWPGPAAARRAVVRGERARCRAVPGQLREPSRPPPRASPPRRSRSTLQQSRDAGAGGPGRPPPGGVEMAKTASAAPATGGRSWLTVPRPPPPALGR
ncbi:hypothetical protein HBB16_14230 [Pseudonocardia sp. MCCB 268]|nr:hypothetical protein [Pseudonocardia cytotoxica]